MKTEDFLDILEQRQLVSTEIVGKLRAKARQSDTRITAKSVLKYLVKKELVTRRQAKELLATTLTVNDKAESSILGFVPLAQPPRPEDEPGPPIVADRVAEEPSLADEPAKEATAAEETGGPSAPGTPAASGLLAEAVAAGKTDSSFAEELAEAAPAAATKRRPKKKPRKNEWDSPLLLLGGGALVLLIVGGGLIYYLLVRENSDAVLKEATDFFAGGSYTQAARSYEHFIETWPNHPEHSRANVRLGMTKIWIAVESGDYSEALETSQQALDEIEEEDAFAEDRESKAELSSLLTRIAEGLAAAAEQSDDSETIRQKIDEAKEVIGLTGNTRYVPSSLQLKDRLQVVRETLDRVEQQQQRNVDLAQAVATIDEAVQAGQIAAAYEAYQGLVKQYPGLDDNEQLAAKVREIAAAEQATVQFTAQQQPASAASDQSPVDGALALAQRSGTAGPDAGVALIVADDALFGIDVKTGKPLWRRPVSLAPNAWPLLIDDRVYASDRAAGELVCLQRQSGELLWRQPLEERLATPVVHGEQLLVAGGEGKLYVVDQQEGMLRGVVQFSQPLLTAPAVNPRTGTIYVAGRHSTLYTLSGEDFACTGVYYLGHAPQSIATPPTVVFNQVIVAHNLGTSTSRLLALGVDPAGVIQNVSAERRLAGLVTTPLAVEGRRVAAATSQGEAAVYEVGAGEGDTALVDVAARQGDRRQPLAHFAWMGDRQLWLAGGELTKFAILPSGNRLPVRSLDRDYSAGVFDQPLQVYGETLVHVRRVDDEAGIVVGATHRSEGRAIWETRLAVPLAGSPAVDSTSSRVTATDTLGFVYHVGPDAFARGVADQSADQSISGADLPREPLTTSVDLGAGRQAASGSSAERLVHYNPTGTEGNRQTVALPAPLACELTSWGGAIVAAAEAGPVMLLSSEAAKKRATSFLPEISPGQTFEWLTPAATGMPGEGALFLCDPADLLYRVELVEAPRPHLAAVATRSMESQQPSTRLAIVGEVLYVGNDRGQLLRYAVEDLAPAEPIDLGNSIVWGPYSAGDSLLVGLADKELVAVGEDGQIRWRQTFERGPLVGAPQVVDQAAWVTHRRGGIARFSLIDGIETHHAAISQPLATGPVLLGAQLLVASADGALLLIDPPVSR